MALVLAACAPLRTDLPLDQLRPVQAAEHAFRALGFEPGSALAGFEVQWARDAVEYSQLCNGQSAEHSAACSAQRTTLSGRAHPRAVLRPGQPLYDPDGCSVVSHEAIHWLLSELRLAPRTAWGQDGAHADPRFWGRSRSGTAEQLACAWLREHR